MFANRDARAKLANMGGILASSPEMVNVTQQFAPGGMVTVDANGMTGTFSTEPQPSFLERLIEDLMRKVKNNEPFNDRDVQVYDSLPTEVKQRINVNSAEGLDTTDNDRARRGPGRTAMDFSSNVGIMSAAPSVEAVNPALDDPTTKLDQTPQLDMGLSAFQLQELQKQRDAYQENLREYQEDYPETELASAEILSDPEIAPERINVNSAELLDTSDNDRARRGPGRTAMDFSTETIPTASVEEKSEVEPSAGESLLDSNEFIFAPDAGYPFPIDVRDDPKYEGKSVADALTTSSNLEELSEQLEKNLQEKKKEVADKLITSSPPDDGSRAGQEANADVEPVSGFDSMVPLLRPDNLNKIAEKINKSNDPSDELTKTVLKAANEDFEGMDMPERISSYKKILSDLLGTDTKEDKKEEFWMNMAMVGFAVAAGDDPSAVKNIADGLLAGSKMMKQDKASNQARQDKINMMSLEESNKDKRLAARLRSAENLAGIRAAGETGMRNYKSPIDAIQFKENELATAIDNGTLVLKEGETIQSLALASVIPLYEAMGVDMSTFKTLGSSTSTESEDDGLVDVVQNGKTFRVPKSQIK
tara:strand:+ start:550 stop:2322 length:1773 start_codon:yes stop_codon:yes gene_type:complete